MRNALTTLGELIGAALIVTGVAALSVPAALVLAGVFLIAGSVLVAR